ncbi:MAG: Multidrug resistance efflux pump [Verrucomicrobia bacterium]|jgi:HlyD family secretion protein|nr:Multidrug resistance efflux pump [Verrucomicrobiota bacterium]
MKRLNPLSALSLSLLVLLLASGCKPKSDGSWQGYIEGEYVYVSAPVGGTLTTLNVKRGDTVKSAQPLFSLENVAESAAAQEAEQKLAQAKAKRDNLLKGRRPSEIASLEAKLAQNKVSSALAERELGRLTTLQKNNSGAISQEQLDQARTKFDASKAEAQAIEADIATAKLGAREDEIKTAELEIAVLEAALAKVRWAVDQKQQASPTDGVVHDTLYRAGEFVAAGSPIVSLLPPQNIKVRFFIPQDKLATIKTGSPVNISFDGAAKVYAATVSYIATQAEFTPPVIYSQQTRSKLVFMIEAQFSPTDSSALHPGQPVDVKPAS